MRRCRIIGLAATVLAGLALPLASHVLAEYSHQAAVALPPFALVAIVCLLAPRWGTPVVALLGMYAVATAVQAVSSDVAWPSAVTELRAGHWGQLKAPLAALAMGYLLVAVRRRYGMFPAGFRTNLRLLVRRPGLLVRKYWPWLTLLMIGAALDAGTTVAFMLKYGAVAELHPAMRSMAEIYGVWPGVIIGTVGRLGFVLVVAAAWRRWCPWVLGICGGLYLLAAGHNQFGWLDGLLVWLQT